jgi:aspartate/methionine/tyrosine aminotransferase
VNFGTNAPGRHVRFVYANPIERLREGVARIDRFLVKA